MKWAEKLFGGIKMGWAKTLLFSLAAGVFCGVFGGLPALYNTSFNDMAGGYEWWVIFAVIIAVNCKSFVGAGLKVGTFFLVSQSVELAVEALLYSHDFDRALYYLLLWAPVIAATYIGGAIAYFSKKQNVLGAVILGIGCSMEALMAVHYVIMFFAAPPRHLLAAAVSLLSFVFMPLLLQKNTKGRIVCYSVAAVIAGLVAAFALLTGRSL